jgi:ribosome assembly protein 4
MHIAYRCVVIQVYSVDWSPDGQRVASGGKDRVLKM